MKTVLAVAPNGAIKTKSDVPNIPMAADELGADAKACLIAGASMIHLHVRDDNGKHSLDCDLYQQAINQVSNQTDGQMFIQLTSEAVGKFTPEEQFEMIHKLKPQGVSIGLREIRGLDHSAIKTHFLLMRKNNVCPQLILYNHYDLAMYKEWMDTGILIGRAYPVLYVIGKHQPEGVFDVELFNEDLTQYASSWMVCAFGAQEYLIGKQAAINGGHIRLGFENNHSLNDGSLAKNNAELIQQMSDELATHNLEIASYKDACAFMKPDW